MTQVTSTPARSFRPSVPQALTILLGLATFVFALAFTRSDQPTVTIAVAATDLAAGTQLVAEDLAPQQITIDGLSSDLFLLWDQIDNTRRTTTRSIAEGEPMLASDLRLPGNSSTNQRIVSIPVDPDRAIPGGLLPGDTIDVIRADKDGAAFVIAQGLVIVSLPEPKSSGGDIAIVVETPAETVLPLIAAAEQGELYVARSSGADPMTETQFRATTSEET